MSVHCYEVWIIGSDLKAFMVRLQVLQRDSGVRDQRLASMGRIDGPDFSRGSDAASDPQVVPSTFVAV